MAESEGRDSFDRQLHTLGIELSREEYQELSKLNTPEKVQTWLDNIPYNDDYAQPGRVDTAYSPLQVLEYRRAHCFEGALFAYMVNHLHGCDPKLVLLESLEDQDHNICVFRGGLFGRYGANSKADEPSGRPAQYGSLHDLTESYRTWYGFPKELEAFRVHRQDQATIVATFGLLHGYSQEIDLIKKYGPSWMNKREPLWNIYHTYVDSNVKFYDLEFGRQKPHLHSFVRAVRNNWFMLEQDGRGCLNLDRLPDKVRRCYEAAWEADDKGVDPKEIAPDLENFSILEFVLLTGTTPFRLGEMAEEDYPAYIRSGYSI